MKYILYCYKVSADDGKTYTTQWLTEEEAEEHKAMGYIVEKNLNRNPRKVYGYLEKFSLGEITT